MTTTPVREKNKKLSQIRGPRLDEHPSHGRHGQAPVVQLRGELQLALRRVLTAERQARFSSVSEDRRSWYPSEFFLLLLFVCYLMLLREKK